MTRKVTDDGVGPLDFAAISTHSSVLKDPGRMVLRYSDAIRKYALAQVANAETADDVHLLVVQSMLEGRFARTSVAKGRFRFYVQRSVRHAVLTLQRQRSRNRSVLAKLWNKLAPVKEAAPAADAEVQERELQIWRDAVLSRTLASALAELAEYEKERQERTHANVFHTLASLMIEHPELNSEELAQRLGTRVAREFTAGCTRSIVMRMRRKFAELLVGEIAQQVDEPTVDNVLDELAELGLLVHVKAYLPAEHVAASRAVSEKWEAEAKAM